MKPEPRGDERIFARLADGFRGDPAVTEGTGFGSSPGLRTGGKIFALLSRNGELVVKLPKDRVEELVAEGTGDRFDPGHGRLMKEWIAISAGHRRKWKRLAEEAKGYVGSDSKARARRS